MTSHALQAVKTVVWLTVGVCVSAPIFGTYSRLKEGGHEWSRSESIMYYLFGRTTFSLGIAWIIYSAETGIGGI